MMLRGLLDAHRLVVCIGTGGVGKTTISAAMAIDAASQGRRAIVLTIDPARALARAFGFERLGPTGDRISPALLVAAGAHAAGTLDAAMLDQQRAWDALVGRYAPSEGIQRAILRNRFYQELSRQFPGSTEYVAMEEVTRLSASGRYDLIVVDTPPAEHALDFVKAPERLDRLLTREVAAWAEHPELTAGSGGLVLRATRAIGGRTLREITDFFTNAGSLMGAVRARSEAAQSLLRDAGTAFVLVTSADEAVSAAAGELAGSLQSEGIALKGVVGNRMHPLPGAREPEAALAEVQSLLARAPADAARWLRLTYRDGLTVAAAEDRRWSRLRAALPQVSAWAAIPELDHDVCSLRDLCGLAASLREAQTY